MAMRIRELDRKRDRHAIEQLETAFETDVVFEMATHDRSIELVERRLEQPITKRFSIAEVFAPWASWQRGWVAEEDELRGFAAVEYEPWHQRLVLWFLYIEPAWRRRSIGRALLERVEAYGREVAATHVWLETSDVNVPGIRAYNRLGYALCGADALYYGAYMPGERAVYLAKMLT